LHNDFIYRRRQELRSYREQSLGQQRAHCCQRSLAISRPAGWRGLLVEYQQRKPDSGVEYHADCYLQRQSDELLVGRMHQHDQYLCGNVIDHRHQTLLGHRKQRKQHQFALSDRRRLASRASPAGWGFVLARGKQHRADRWHQHNADRHMHRQSDHLLLGRLHKLYEYLRRDLFGGRNADLHRHGEQWRQHEFADLDQCQLAGDAPLECFLFARLEQHVADHRHQHYVDRDVYRQSDELCMGWLHELHQYVRHDRSCRRSANIFRDSEQWRRHEHAKFGQCQLAGRRTARRVVCALREQQRAGRRLQHYADCCMFWRSYGLHLARLHELDQ